MTFARTLLLLIACLFPAVLSAQEGDARVFSKSLEDALTDRVVVLEIGQKDLVNSQAFAFWQRILERANEEKARAVVLEINTPGGLAFDTRKLIMDDLLALEIPLVAWVKREALSAGAMIAFASDTIYMAEGTTIGSAAIVNGGGQPIEDTMRAKLESAFEASMRAVAEEKKHRFEVLQAMMIVDEDEERTIGPVTVRKGGLLNLTAAEATADYEGSPLLAKAIANSLEEVLEMEGLSDAELIRPEQTGFEKMAYYLAAVSPLLLLIGIGGAWLEFKAPGFGFFGILSLVAFGLFFFGNNVAGNLAGYELLALFVLGVVLIILELFLLPSGIAGIIGVVCVLASLWLSMADSFEFDRIGDPVGFSYTEVFVKPGIKLLSALLATFILVAVIARYLPNVPLFRRLVLAEDLPSGSSIETSTTTLVGERGTCVTDLRPSGKVLIAGRKYDASLTSGFLESGSEVVVVSEGLELKVQAV